jgi:hypothetical protein
VLTLLWVGEGRAVQGERGQCGMCSVGMQGVCMHQQQGASTSPPEALSGDGARVRPPSLAGSPHPLVTVRTGPRMQSGVFFLYTLPSHQESERCCDGFSRDPPVAVRAWRAVYPYEGH